MSSEASKSISYRLHVTEARDLTSKDFNGLSDPYAKVRWGGQKFKTEIKKKTLNPRWSAEFILKADSDDATTEEITIEVWDHDVVTSDELIGSVQFNLKDWLKSGSTAIGWYPLSKPKKKASACGEIHLRITKLNGDDSSSASAPATPSLDENGKAIKKAHRASESKEKSKKRTDSSSSSSSKSRSSSSSTAASATPAKPKITVVECDIPKANGDDDPAPTLPLLAHQRDRLADLRRAAAINTKMKTTSVFGTPVMESFFSIVSQVKPKLSVVKISNQELKSLYQQYFAAIRDEERNTISKRVDELIQQTNKNFTAIGVAMRQIDDSNKKFEKSIEKSPNDDTSRNEKRVRTNVTTILARAFLENMVQFQDAQQQFKSMHTTRVKQLYLISNPSASQAELDDLASMDLSVSEVFEQKFSATRHKAAQQALAYVKAKHKDILAIENGLRELQELFNQCAALVAMQREFIDQISANIDRTYESLKAANQDIYKARYYQKHRFALSAPQYDRLYKS